MKNKITYKDIVKLQPCYNPSEIGMNEDYSDTIPNFIDEFKDKVKDKEDIIWLICSYQYMTNKDMRLFAVWCAREALKLVKNPDERSVNACNIAEQFANGEATQDELDAARTAARPAAMDAARTAAMDAGRAARTAAWAAQFIHLKTYFG